MKIISSTSRISIMGVMLIFDWGPLPPPTDIAIKNCSLKILIEHRRNFQRPAPRVSEPEIEPRSAFRLRRKVIVENLLRQQAHVVDSTRPEIVYNVFDCLVLGARIGPDVNDLIGLVRKEILHFGR